MPGELHSGASGVTAHDQQPTSPAVQSGVQKSRKSAKFGVSSVTDDGAPGTGSTLCAAPCTCIPQHITAAYLPDGTPRRHSIAERSREPYAMPRQLNLVTESRAYAWRIGAGCM